MKPVNLTTHSSSYSSSWPCGLCVIPLLVSKIKNIALLILKYIISIFSNSSTTKHRALESARTVLIPKPALRQGELNSMGLAFYRGESPTAQGKTFEQILSFSDSELEEGHSYIQWLFINFDPSGSNSQSPIFTQQTVTAFKTDAMIRAKLMRAFDRMLAFYGLERISQEETVLIQCSNQWNVRKLHWLTPGFSHNYLRMTRIMVCLMATNFQAEAQAYYTLLLDISKNDPDISKKITKTTLDRWVEVMKPNSPDYAKFH